MKSLIKLLSLIALITITTTSCNKYDDLEDFDQVDSFDNDQSGDGFGDGSNDGSGDGSNDDDNTGGQGQSGESGGLTLYRVTNGTTITKIKDYEVSGDLKSYQQDEGKHFKMWEFYTQLIPESQRKFITEFEVFHGGNELAGYVNAIGEDNSKWKLGLAIDLADDLSTIDLQNEFTYTCIHEQGHILTLNSTQLDANAGSCSNFQVSEGCAKSNAYINRLFELGWADIYEEHQNLNTDQEVQDFYNKYSTRFVSNYAATNPGEDIAEVFAYYVTSDQLPSGNSIADKKIRLLSEFPELVELRQQIRQNPTLTRLVPGSWKARRCKHESKKGKSL